MGLKIECHFFANDIKHYRILKTQLDCIIIQKDLDKLATWTRT